MRDDSQLPRFIALCGNPTAGKSEVQRILQESYGVQPVDDGGPLRKMAIDYIGLKYEDCYTQEGKLRFTEILGKVWEHRGVLGEIGNAFEEKFGGDIIPLMVVNSLPVGGHYCFGSVRRQQGWFYKRAGGVVLGIRRPGAGPSKFAFDVFDHAAVDIWIDNAGSIADLEEKVHGVVTAYSAMMAKTEAA